MLVEGRLAAPKKTKDLLAPKRKSDTPTSQRHGAPAAERPGKFLMPEALVVAALSFRQFSPYPVSLNLPLSTVRPRVGCAYRGSEIPKGLYVYSPIDHWTKKSRRDYMSTSCEEHTIPSGFAARLCMAYTRRDKS